MNLFGGGSVARWRHLMGGVATKSVALGTG